MVFELSRLIRAQVLAVAAGGKLYQDLPSELTPAHVPSRALFRGFAEACRP